MKNTRTIAQAGVIAAVYAAFTLLVIQSPLGYGPVQFRLSEALTVAACLTSAAVPGLAIGTFLANMFMLTQAGLLGLFDVVFGSIGTLLGAMWSWRYRTRPGIALLGPVVSNALIVPAYLPLLLSQISGLDFYNYPAIGLSAESGWLALYLFGVCTVGVGQAVVIYGLGMPLLAILRRLGVGFSVRPEERDTE